MNKCPQCGLLFLLIIAISTSAFAIDEKLRPPTDDSDQVANVYQDMIIVQRKAKEKAGKYVFGSSASIEFSDGPQSIYGLNLDFGRAISDHLEIYANIVPFFMTQDRQIKKTVEDLDLNNGKKAELVSPDPKLQYGVALLWLPAYGKDSWGPTSIVRSDTFFKFYAGMMQFASGSGLRLSAGIGKTFFLSKYFNPRISTAISMQENIVNDKKTSSQVGLFEMGSVWYF